IANSLGGLGSLAAAEGNHAEAKTLFHESLAHYASLADRGGVALVITYLGELAWKTGDYSQATLHLERSLASFREAGSALGIALALMTLGCLAADQGEFARALGLLAESLLLRHEAHDRGGTTECIEAIARAAAGLARSGPERSQVVRFFSAASQMRQEIGFAIPSHDRDRAAAELAALRSALGDGE